MNGNNKCKQQAIDNCSFVKTILMLLVILYHSCAYWTGTWFDKAPLLNSQLLSVFAKWLNSFHIYGFVLVSGYIYSFGKNERGKYQKRAEFLLGKAKRLILPYYFVVVVWVIPIQQFFFHKDTKTIIKDYILANNPNQLWFLWMLFIVFFIMCFATKVVDRSYILAGLIAVVGYGMYLIFFGRILDCFQFLMAMRFLPVFIIGYFMRKVDYPHIPWIIWLIFDMVLFYTYEYAPTDGIVLKVAHYANGFILNIVGAIMIFEVLQTLASIINWQKWKIFKCIAAYSMPMYLFHQQFVYIGIVILNGRVNPWINAGFNFAIASTGSFLISWFLMHWKSTKILIGEK